jgi:hypothetical protein
MGEYEKKDQYDKIKTIFHAESLSAVWNDARLHKANDLKDK